MTMDTVTEPRVGESSRDPIANNDQAPVLRLLSGPQAGAEVELREGAWHIGSAEHDDIVLRGGGVSAEHAVLRVGPEALQLEAVAASVLTAEGELAPGEFRRLNGEAQFALGDVQIGVGVASTDWSAMPFLTRPAAAPAGAAEAVSDPDANHLPENGADSSPAAGTRPEPRRLYKFLPLALGILLIIAGGLLFLGYLSDGSTPPPAVPETTQLQKAKQILRKLRYDQVEAQLINGTVVLSGYCRSNARLAELEVALAGAGLEVDNKIHSFEHMNLKISQTLSELGGDRMTHSLTIDAVLYVKGFFDSEMSPAELMQELKADIPEVRDVKLNITNLEDARRKLMRLLAAAGLGQSVLVTAWGGELITTAADGASVQLDQWEKVADTFDKETGGVPEVVSRIEYAPQRRSAAEPGPGEDPSEQPLQLTTIVMIKGGEHFAVLSGLGEVRVGDWVGGGYRLSEIHPEYIVISHGSEKKILQLRDYGQCPTCQKQYKEISNPGSPSKPASKPTEPGKSATP